MGDVVLFISDRVLTRRRGVFRRRGTLASTWTPFTFLMGPIQIHVVGKAGWGYTAFAYRSPRKGDVPLWGVWDYQGMSDVKKKKKADAAVAAKHLAPMETHILRDHLPILEHCAATQYEDGDARKPGWITLRTFGSTWQLEIKDPDTLQMMRITQPTLDDALTMAALLLASEDAPWEPDTWAMQQARKSKK